MHMLPELNACKVYLKNGFDVRSVRLRCSRLPVGFPSSYGVLANWIPHFVKLFGCTVGVTLFRRHIL